MRPRLVALAFALIGAAVASSGCLLNESLVGEPAPPFRLVTGDGQVVNETTHLGKFLILDLMATWCGPCVLEVAHLREIQQRYGDQVEILSVGIDPSFDTPDSLEAFSEEYGASWPHALDVNRSVSQSFRLGIVPKLVIIDPEGIVVLERQGEVLPAAMARVIDPHAPPESPRLVLPVLTAAGLGFLGAFNPYRRFHREGRGHLPTILAGALLAGIAILAWSFLGFASSRATLGSLALGALTLGAAAWWLRARRREPQEQPPSTYLAGADRAYEAAPHFMLALVLGLQTTGWAGFFAPVVAFLAGAALATAMLPRLPEAGRVRIGLVGLALAGAGLLLFGMRLVVLEV